jgi:hypothetical protein
VIENEEDEEEMTIQTELRWAGIFGCALAAEIAAYFPLRDAFPDYVVGGLIAITAHATITLTAGLAVLCLVNAAYLLGYMTWDDFRCFFPRRQERGRSLMDYTAGIVLTLRCFRRAWDHDRWWPTVMDGFSVVRRSAKLKGDNNDRDRN